MMNPENEVLVWYIDMIAGQGKDTDGVVYIDDLYLDLVVYPDGTVLEDDMDELEEALRNGDISQELFDLAIETCGRLKNGLLRKRKVGPFVRLASLTTAIRKCSAEFWMPMTGISARSSTTTSTHITRLVQLAYSMQLPRVLAL